MNRGDRVAQLICEKIAYPELQEAEKLDETERGASGFGSTGVQWFQQPISEDLQFSTIFQTT